MKQEDRSEARDGVSSSLKHAKSDAALCDPYRIRIPRNKFALHRSCGTVSISEEDELLGEGPHTPPSPLCCRQLLGKFGQREIELDNF